MPETRTCEFCGARKVTREHIWPNWLRNYLPRDSAYHGTAVGLVEREGRLATVEPGELRQQTGDMLSRKLRIACATCNNGWMSRLQNEAKPLLVPLLGGGWPHLGAAEQKALASWAVMFTMVVELLDPRTNAHTFEDRKAFALDQTPPDGWEIFIGHAREWPWHFWHYGWKLASPTDQMNVQATTFGVGDLIIYAYSFGKNNAQLTSPFAPSMIAKAFGVRQIWPTVDDPVLAPTAGYVPHDEIIGLSAIHAMFFGGYVNWGPGRSGVFAPWCENQQVLFIPFNRLTTTLGTMWSVVTRPLRWWRRMAWRIRRVR